MFFLKSYRKPRELTWLTGILLLFLMLGFGFSGYLLPWNELSFFATKVGTGIAGAVPLIGRSLLRLLRGGDDVTGATLSRFYGLHVAILPAITTALVAAHLLLVQRQGMSVPLEHRARAEGRRASPLPQMQFFPNYILRDVLAWYVALAVRRGARGVLSRGSSATKADPFAAVPPGIRPEWYFLAMFHTLKLVPSHVLGFEGEQLGVVGVRPGRAVSGARAVSRSTGEPRRAQPAVHGPRGARPGRIWSCSPSSGITPSSAVMSQFTRRSLLLLAALALLRAVARGRAAGAGRQQLPDVPLDAHRRQAGDAGGALLRTRRPPRARLRLRRLPRRRSREPRQGARPRRGARVQGSADGPGTDRDLRALPQRRRSDAPLRAEAARGSGGRVRHQRARQAAGRRTTRTSRPAPAATARTASGW